MYNSKKAKFSIDYDKGLLTFDPQSMKINDMDVESIAQILQYYPDLKYFTVQCEDSDQNIRTSSMMFFKEEIEKVLVHVLGKYDENTKTFVLNEKYCYNDFEEINRYLLKLVLDQFPEVDSIQIASTIYKSKEDVKEYVDGIPAHHYFDSTKTLLLGSKYNSIEELNLKQLRQIINDFPLMKQLAIGGYSYTKQEVLDAIARIQFLRDTIQESSYYVPAGIKEFFVNSSESAPKVNEKKELLLNKKVNFDNPKEVEEFVCTLLLNLTAEVIVFPNGKRCSMKEVLTLFQDTQVLDSLIQDFEKLNKIQPLSIATTYIIASKFKVFHPDNFKEDEKKIQNIAKKLYTLCDSIVLLCEENREIQGSVRPSMMNK